jgi:hypothetical protein
VSIDVMEIDGNVSVRGGIVKSKVSKLSLVLIFRRLRMNARERVSMSVVMKFTMRLRQTDHAL